MDNNETFVCSECGAVSSVPGFCGECGGKLELKVREEGKEPPAEGQGNEDWGGKDDEGDW